MANKEYKRRKTKAFSDKDVIDILTHNVKNEYQPEITTVGELVDYLTSRVPEFTPPAYAQMFQLIETEYPITAGLVGQYLGSVGAAPGVFENATIELFESIGGPGSLNPPQDSFLIEVDGVYRMNIQVSLTSDTNNTVIDTAIYKNGIYEPGTDFNLITGSQGENRTFGMSKLIPAVAGDRIYLVGKADKECTVTIKASMMNIVRIASS